MCFPSLSLRGIGWARGNGALVLSGRSRLFTLTWELEDGEGHEVVRLDDMGEGCLVLSQRNEAGRVERVAVTLGMLQQAIAAVMPRYCAGAGAIRPDSSVVESERL